MIGSYYGEDIYSAELYSWETAWEGLVCTPNDRVPVQPAQPTAVWPGLECGSIPRNVRHLPSLVNWPADDCQHLDRHQL